MSTGKERMETLLAHLKMNANEFASSLGYKRTDRIYNILSGRNGISTAVARDIHEHHESISYEWIAKGEGEMLAPQTGEKELVKINMLNIPIPLETSENAPQGNFSERRRMVERIKLIEPNFKTERPNSISIALSGLVEKSPTQALWVMTGKDDKVVLDRTQYEMMLEKMSLLEKLNKIYREESASDANIIPPSVKHL